MPKLVIGELGQLMQHRGSCAPDCVEFEYGPLAVSAIGHATADDLLSALRGMLPDSDARTVVGILQGAGLTFDSIVAGEICDAR